MRSGSTLLRLCLDSHPNLAIGPESGFMGAAEALHTIPGWSLGEGWYRRLGIDDADHDQRVAAFFDEMFSGYAAAKGKTRWGDKTPFHTWHINNMARLFPEASFVGIVRHPGATVASTRRWRYDLDDAISKWTRATTEILRRAVELGPSRFAICRYEDLVLAPEPTLRSLLDFLGEPWSEAVMHHERQGSQIVEGGTNTGDAIDPSRVAKWVAEMTNAERRLLATRVPASLDRILGYQHDDPMPRDVGQGLWSLDGADLSGLPHGKYDSVDLDPLRRSLPTDADELAHRLAKAERKLAQTRVRARAGRATRRLMRDLFSRARPATGSPKSPEGARA
jgi:hypothetical protein